MRLRLGGRRLGSLALALLLASCGGEPPDTGTGNAAGNGAEPLGVVLDSEDQARLGIAVAPIERGTFEPGTEGPARVVDAQSIIAGMAELARAEAAVRASRSARARARELYKIDTAVSAETLETAERQAAADAAQLDVARAQARLGFGSRAPWLDDARREALLAALGAGTAVVVSAAFPSGFDEAAAGTLSVRRLGGGAGAQSWRATESWRGPADPNVPGPTVLALIERSALVAGERLVARVAADAPLTGVVVPASAVVLAGGQAWCYVGADEGSFVRRPLDLQRPTATGYFQTSGFDAGQNVVIAGAGLLLAHETGGGEED